jgi:hypothetical protein
LADVSFSVSCSVALVTPAPNQHSRDSIANFSQSF